MSKDSSAKHYQNDKESERYQSLSKEENKKKHQNGHKQYKIYQKVKNKSLLGIEKNILK